MKPWTYRPMDIRPGTQHVQFVLEKRKRQHQDGLQEMLTIFGKADVVSFMFFGTERRVAVDRTNRTILAVNHELATAYIVGVLNEAITPEET